MKEIEERILKDGVVIDNEILKLDSFLNHQVGVNLLNDFAKEVKEELGDVKVDKILTIETSGVAVAYALAQVFNVPFVYAKKSKSKIVDDNIYRGIVSSFTKGNISEISVSKQYLLEGERVLIADDFLALGNAAMGLIDVCDQAKAKVVGFVAFIEKSCQGGRKRIEELGYTVISGADVKEFRDNRPVF